MASLEIAWIGTGVMGSSMARHLMAAGHTLRVHTRTPARAKALLDDGARWAASPAAAADGADVACSMVGYPEDVEAVHLGPGGSPRRPRPSASSRWTPRSPAGTWAPATPRCP